MPAPWMLRPRWLSLAFVSFHPAAVSISATSDSIAMSASGGNVTTLRSRGA